MAGKTSIIETPITEKEVEAALALVIKSAFMGGENNRAGAFRGIATMIRVMFPMMDLKIVTGPEVFMFEQSVMVRVQINCFIRGGDGEFRKSTFNVQVAVELQELRHKAKPKQRTAAA